MAHDVFIGYSSSGSSSLRRLRIRLAINCLLMDRSANV
jgi:hypothetical protein